MSSIGSMVRRLVGHWTHAREARIAGARWYKEARRTSRALARTHGVRERAAAGVIAALSPRLTWSYNVRAAEMVLAGAAEVPGVFRASLAKARAIAAGARPLRVLGGSKVRAFYRALCGDESSAVVDVWTVRAAMGRDANVTDKVYTAIAAALVRAARLVRSTVARVQATAWVAVRGRAS